MATATDAVLSDLPDLAFTRMLDAPRDLVFQAWTDARHVAAWWGPTGFSNPVCEVDPRRGGRFAVHMQAPNGTIYPGGGVFLEIAAPERLIFTSTLEGRSGQILLEAVNSVTFEDFGRRTRLHLNARVVSAAAESAGKLGGMEEGWAQSLERLAGILKAAGGVARPTPRSVLSYSAGPELVREFREMPV